MKISAVAIGLVVLLGGATLRNAFPAPAGFAGSTFCSASNVSRWSTETGNYQRTQVFGDAPGSWLVDVTGIAATADRVFIHDGAEARVHVLSSTLQPLHHFGRRGDGPGELNIPIAIRLDRHRHLTANSLTVDDSLVYVYDGRSVQTYRFDGTYVDRVASIRDRPRFTVEKLQATRHGLMFSFDTLDMRGNGQRRLQTWRARGGSVSLVHSVQVPGPSVHNGRYNASSRDPRPLWAVHNHCLAWSDGVSHHIIRTDLAAATVDTVRLPPHQVPPMDYDYAEVKRMAKSMGFPPPIRRSPDAPLWHWSSLLVDPDGHIWVRPWTGGDKLNGPVYRVDPRGIVHEEQLPAFPMAFGPPGVFYAREKDAATDVLRIVRYERPGTSNGARPRPQP